MIVFIALVAAHGGDAHHGHDADAPRIHGTTCGHAHYSEHFPEPVRVPQSYAGQTPHSEVERRRLVPQSDQTYAGQTGTDFLPLEGATSAQSQGLLTGIRVKINFEMIEGTIKDIRACYEGDELLDVSGTLKGKKVKTDKLNPNSTTTDVHNTYEYRCMPEDVITDVKKAIVKKRINWLGGFVTSMLEIKPMTDVLDVSTALLKDTMGGPGSPDVSWANTVNAGGPITELSYPNYDLVIYVQMRPDPSGATAGYASCRQRDQWGRCTVGNFNWSPAVLEPGEMLTVADVADDSKEDPTQQAQERHTALHEVIHVLGGIKPDNQIKADGTTKPKTEVYIIDDDTVALGDGTTVTRQTQKMITPRVLEIARKQFGCAEMKGMPLEDQLLGRGAHWEARLMGPEVMSYGSYTGESYLSDLTIAMLQDTGHYIGNHTVAGRLVPAAPCVTLSPTRTPTGNECAPFETCTTLTSSSPPPPLAICNRIIRYAPKMSSVGDLWSTGATGKQEGVDSFTATPGYLRWGRKQGCAFVEGNPQDWSERYACTTDEAEGYGCTADNRMSARCVMNVWGTAATAQATTKRTAKKFVDPLSSIDDSDGVAVNVVLTPQNSVGSGAALPPLYQYPKITGDGAKTYLAGWSDAMDFVPVKVGSYSCLDNKAIFLSGGAAKASGGNKLTMAMDNVYGDITTYGGQYRSEKSRCFVSSLQSAKTFNPAFSKLGLCYASNCFKRDYLQVGVLTKLGGIQWYGCPRGGGKVYISGFLGSVHCPDAEDFCVQEDITGHLYAEVIGWWVEWVFWGVAFVVFVCIPCATCCICFCCSRLRRFCARVMKAACGIWMAHGELGQSKAFKIAKTRRDEVYVRVRLIAVLARRALSARNVLTLTPYLVTYAATSARARRTRCAVSTSSTHSLAWGFASSAALASLCAGSLSNRFTGRSRTRPTTLRLPASRFGCTRSSASTRRRAMGSR